jgi:hypothetical protein
VNDPFRLILDATLVGVALLGVIAFILFDRPRFHVALMFFIALAWGIELTVVLSRSPAAPGLYLRLHPLVSIATTLAAVVIVATRGRAPKA